MENEQLLVWNADHFVHISDPRYAWPRTYCAITIGLNVATRRELDLAAGSCPSCLRKALARDAA